MSVSQFTPLQAWLYLLEGPGLGPVSLKRLYQHFGCANEILLASDEQLTQLGLRTHSRRYICRADTAYQRIVQQEGEIQSWLSSRGGQLLCLESPLYPPLLRELSDPPTILYVLGDPTLLALPQIAIVGSRNPSIYGEELAQNFANQLSLNGYIPTSGLALGIDSRVHQGALKGLGLTVAVLGTGVDQIYPVRNKGLADKILNSGGCVVSEYSLGTPPKANNFPKRNRIISGLSLATLVVEASLGSGSLITAKQALAQGRDVLAIPGSIHNPMSKGCHHLLREGAKLVEEVKHIFEEIAPQMDISKQSELFSTEIGGKIADLSQPERELVALIGYEQTSVDTLISRSNLPPDSVLSTLVELELKDIITSVGGGYQRLN